VADNLNEGTAAVMWDQHYELPATTITSTQSNIFSSTQVKMLDIADTFQHIASFPQA
jgi:hypothetical protein